MLLAVLFLIYPVSMKGRRQKIFQGGGGQRKEKKKKNTKI